MRKFALLLVGLCLAGSFPGDFRAFAAGNEARAWVDTVPLTTWLEGPANPNPPFDQFSGDGPFLYPYTWRTSFTQNKVTHDWRALRLENEYLKCTILVDLGGRLTCQDKVNGKELFYANPSVKKQFVALRGAWAATGVEYNFPVGHSLVTVSPVDFAARQNPDGSASAWISSVDRVSGLEMRIEFVLRPGSALLTQNVTLANPTSVRHRFYWWNNAEVLVEDASTTVVMPANVISHPTKGLDTWPKSANGSDLSTYGGQKDQTIAFAYGSKEPFFGVYQPRSKTGIAHYANPAAVAGKKMWNWGTSDTWARLNLSDNNAIYMEIQAGLLQNQETYDFLNPGESRTFTEYWIPIRALDGLSRATPDGVLNYQRNPDSDGTVTVLAEFLPMRAAPGATVRLMDGAKAIQQAQVNLAPEAPSTATFAGVPASASYRLEIVDAQGNVLVSHNEGPWDAVKPSEVKLGPQPAPNFANPFTQAEFLAAAANWEMLGDLNKTAAVFDKALTAYPQSAALLAAGGRASVEMNRFQEAVTRLTSVLGMRPDPESRFYLGVAYEGLGDDEKAKAAFAAVLEDSAFGRSAKFGLVRIQARAGDYAGALAILQPVLGNAPAWSREGAVEVALLRKLNRPKDAQARLDLWLSVNPSDLFLRFERLRQPGNADLGFFRQLAADPERVLDIATHLFGLGLYEDALMILDRNYNEIVDPVDAEPGRVSPQSYPLVTYYQAFALEKLGQSSAAQQYKLASSQSIQYVFPSRPGSAKVLSAATERNPNDANAHALLGSLRFAFRQTDEAIAEWQKARALNKNLPMLQRNLGRALLEVKSDPRAAIPVLREGLSLDPNNQEMQNALAKAQDLADKSPAPGKRK